MDEETKKAIEAAKANIENGHDPLKAQPTPTTAPIGGFKREPEPPAQKQQEPAPGAEGNAPPADAGAQGGQPTHTPKTVTMATGTVNKIKQEAAQKALQRLAKKYGFASVEDMDAALAAKSSPPAAQKPPAQKPPAQQQPAAQEPPPARGVNFENLPPEARPSLGDQERINKLAQERGRAEKQVRQLKMELEAERSDNVLRMSAMRAGIMDPDRMDYAIHLLKRHLGSITEAEVDAFDPDTYFPSLSEKHAYLFATSHQPPEQVVGSTTPGSEAGKNLPTMPANQAGPQAGGGAAPAAPSKGPITQTQPKVDAMNMSPQEWEEHKRKQGWNRVTPSSSIPTAAPARSPGQRS